MRSSAPLQQFRPLAFSAASVATPASVNETVLKSFTVPANLISAIGTRIKGRFRGAFAANANTKNVRIRLGPVTLTGTVMFATGAVAFNGTDWWIDFELETRAASGQTLITAFLEDGAVAANCVDIQTAGAANNDALAMLIELTGQNGVATAADIICVEHFLDLILPPS